VGPPSLSAFAPGRPVVERYSITRHHWLQADSSILRGCLLVLPLLAGSYCCYSDYCVGVLFLSGTDRRDERHLCPTVTISSTNSPNSVCSTCLRKVEAKVLIQGNNVYLQKYCPQHKLQRVLISTDAEYYKLQRRFIKPAQMPLKFNTPIRYGLPLRLRPVPRS